MDPSTSAVVQVCVVGAGRIGGPLAVVLAAMNPDKRFVVYDQDTERVQQWNSQHPPFYEPKLQEISRIGRCGINTARERSHPTCSNRSPNLVFVNDVDHICSPAIVFLCIPFPSDFLEPVVPWTETNQRFIDSLCSISKRAGPQSVFVNRATGVPSTTDRLRNMIAGFTGHQGIEVVAMPEFLAEGTAVRDILSPDRLVIGHQQTRCGRLAVERLGDLFRWLPTSSLITTTPVVAEMAKLCSNAMLAQRISTVNAIAVLCGGLTIPAVKVLEIVGRDHRIGSQYLRPGIGYAGPCLTKDVAELETMARIHGEPEIEAYWSRVQQMNEFQPPHLLRKLLSICQHDLSMARIAIFGYCFKDDTGETRNSPAIPLIHSLQNCGVKEVTLFDPSVSVDTLQFALRKYLNSTAADVVRCCTSAIDACQSANVVIVLCKSKTFQQYVGCRPLREEAPSSQPSPAIPPVAQMLEEACARVDKRIEARSECSRPCLLCQDAIARADAAQAVSWQAIANVMAVPRVVIDCSSSLNPLPMLQCGIRLMTFPDSVMWQPN